MKEIEILYDLPIIFTRDKQWAKEFSRIKTGDIIILPDDAVLVLKPINAPSPITKP